MAEPLPASSRSWLGHEAARDGLEHGAAHREQSRSPSSSERFWKDETAEPRPRWRGLEQVLARLAPPALQVVLSCATWSLMNSLSEGAEMTSSPETTSSAACSSADRSPATNTPTCPPSRRQKPDKPTPTPMCSVSETPSAGAKPLSVSSRTARRRAASASPPTPARRQASCATPPAARAANGHVARKLVDAVDELGEVRVDVRVRYSEPWP